MESSQYKISIKRSAKDLTRETQDTDIWTGEQFELGSRSTFHHGMELVDVFLKMKLKSTDNIVDMGCGNGNITRCISDMIKHKKIYAFDLQPSMIEFAKENHQRETIDYFVANAGAPWDELEDSLKKLENTIDVVYSNYVMYLVRNQNAAFKNISKLLKDGGYLLINIPVIPDLNDFFEFSEEEKEKNAKYINMKTKEEQIRHYNKLITGNGFQILSMNEFLGEWRYDSMDDLMDIMPSVAKGMASKVLKGNINGAEKKDLILNYSALFEGALRNKNFQTPPDFPISELLNLNGIHCYRARYICKINKNMSTHIY